MLLRLLWLKWRTRRIGLALATPTPEDEALAKPWPAASVWAWAAACAGLPLALPFLARSLASGAGEGALSTFNYAWKLVELPLMLAIQLVATLAFPALTRAMAAGDAAATQGLVRQAFALAWTLACAAALVLQVGAPAIASLLFGWGRMDAAALATVAQWGSLGAWGLLPQGLTAVAVTVLAAQGRLKVVAWIHGLAVVVLWWLAPAGGRGEDLMLCLNVVMAGIALCLGVALWSGERRMALLPWTGLVAPLLVLTLGSQAWTLVTGRLGNQIGMITLVLSVFFATMLIAISCLASADLRRSLRR
jgi:peptidoglycan biosynthesis protein MviN/MurJ (putative lipid II flippase)